MNVLTWLVVTRFGSRGGNETGLGEKVDNLIN